MDLFLFDARAVFYLKVGSSARVSVEPIYVASTTGKSSSGFASTNLLFFDLAVVYRLALRLLEKLDLKRRSDGWAACLVIGIGTRMGFIE